MTKAEYLRAIYGKGPIKDQRQWLKWLLKFAEKNLENLNKKEWAKLIREWESLLTFLVSPAYLWQEHLVRPTSQLEESFKKGIPSELKSPTYLISLHQKYSTFVRDGIPETLPGPEPFYVRFLPFPDILRSSSVQVEFQSGVARVRSKARKGKKSEKDKLGLPKTQIKTTLKLVIRADWPEMFWLVVGAWLSEHSFELSRCEECQSLFLQNRQEAFCTKKCANRYRSREWYRTHTAASNLISNRRNKYEENVQKKRPDAVVRKNKRLAKK